MRIGELARRAGCSVETVRYYEKEGLLPDPARSTGNYRLYGPAHLERLSFIRNCRTLEMTLGEIGELLTLKDRASQDCGEVNTLLDAHIGHVADRIARLQLLEAQLTALKGQCGKTQSVEHCGILRELAEPVKRPWPDSPETPHVRGVHPRKG